MLAGNRDYGLEKTNPYTFKTPDYWMILAICLQRLGISNHD
jgi:hypothetical protein